MNILEVQDLCKTYGTGETEVHALNHVHFPFAKANLLPSLASRVPAKKYSAECDRRSGQRHFRQGMD